MPAIRPSLKELSIRRLPCGWRGRSAQRRAQHALNDHRFFRIPSSGLNIRLPIIDLTARRAAPLFGGSTMTYHTSRSGGAPQPRRYGRPTDPFSAGPNASPWQAIAALRPASPGQLALIGVGLWVIGVLLPAVHLLTIVGIALLVVAGLSLFIRPRARTMYWRG